MCIDSFRHLVLNGKECRIDSCIADIVLALNDCGIKTIASCCGHFNRWGNIVLDDGRELIIAPDYDSARAFDKVHGRPISDDRHGLYSSPQGLISIVYKCDACGGDLEFYSKGFWSLVFGPSWRCVGCNRKYSMLS